MSEWCWAGELSSQFSAPISLPAGTDHVWGQSTEAHKEQGIGVEILEILPGCDAFSWVLK